VKFLFIVFLAGYYARHEGELSQFRVGFLKPLLLLGIMAVLYLAEPDFGSTVAVSTVAFGMALVAGVQIRYLASLVGLGLIAFTTLIFVSPYRMRRITSFLAPWEDPSGQGYQLIQSLIAVGSGEFFGSGLGNSQQKLFFLPAAHTDFIFAVIAEEFGFLGACGILLLFLLFLWRGIHIAQRVARDCFLHVLAVGLCLLIVVPALFNLGVVIGLLPTKGMVLPLIGYGGSSVVSCLFIVGLLLAISREGSGRQPL
jgi:cell division protein FtsW